MTDQRFLDDHETDQLGKAWHTLAGLVDQLDDLLAGDVMGKPTALGIRIARAPSSRPPINLAAHDHLDVIQVSVTGWSRCLLDSALVEIPADVRTRSLCRHLHVNADRIAGCDWAPDCLGEVRDLVATAERIVSPDDDGSIADRHHLAAADVHHRAHQATGDAADMVTVHLAVTGQHITEKQIHQWRRRGKLDERIGPGGEPWYHYHEVASVARRTKVRPGTRRAGA